MNRRALDAWFDAGVRRMRCVPWDAATGLRWGALVAELRRSGRVVPVKDSLFAASALVHGLTVATRNTRDFAAAGVKTVDTFVARER
ncbi:MAG: hypothetical protein HMLKMBBP_01761 [Planctomycetes bacterium]|nr:hypothetical protein [Planctomycetota bacterium]